MKRYLLVLATALTAAMTLSATGRTDSDTRPMWGVKAELDLNLPGKWHGSGSAVKMYHHGFGFTAGAVCNLYLGSGFYFEPGVSFFYDSYGYDDLLITDNSGEVVETDPSQYKVGLRVPLVVGYTFNITDQWTMSVFTGPELNYAFGGEIKIKHPEVLGDDFPLSPFTDYQRRVDCAWRIGVGVPYESFLISVQTSLGMTNLLKNGMRFHENRLTASLTYYF